MPKLIGKLHIEYKGETINIGGRTYRDINTVNTVNYIDDRDNRRKSVKYLETSNTKGALYLDGETLIRDVKYYQKPVSRTFNGKEYGGIVSRIIEQDGTRIYEMVNLCNPFFPTDRVEIKPNGEIMEHIRPRFSFIRATIGARDSIVKGAKNLISRFKNI